METESRSPDSLVISYLVLRKTVGILGMALPVVVYLGARLFFQTGIQSSISSYYHTGMRDVFVGILWTIGFFLYSYKGYEAIDNIAGNLACLFAVMVSIFPTTPDGPITGAQKFIGGIHLVSASLFFLTLIYFSYFLFTKTHKNGQSTSNKLKRNMVYKACAYLMSACILLIALYKILPDSTTTGLESIHPIFWLEALAIFTFGISWFTKGEAILWDEN
ncbi:MAG: DUF998 domain-containing protein [Chloroflexi bacterium]|nr:DUF998 domain-containing protein [Chloroflexota bacterium]